MFLNPALGAALDRIAERAADLRRVFTPGAVPQHDDVASAGGAENFTLDPLAVAAPDDIYFVTADEQGRVSYTRDGAFAVRGGRLVDAAGRPVRGVTGTNRDPGDLHIDPVDEALGRAADPRVERDGSFVYTRATIDPRSGARVSQRVVVGRLLLARFPAGTRIRSDDGIEGVPTESVVAQTGFAGDESFPALAAMHVSRSRVDLTEGLARLKEAYLTFDALQAAETAKGHLNKTAMDLLK